MVGLDEGGGWASADDHSAGAWSTWETSTSKLIVDPEYIKKAADPQWYVNPSSRGSIQAYRIIQGARIRADRKPFLRQWRLDGRWAVD